MVTAKGRKNIFAGFLVWVVISSAILLASHKSAFAEGTPAGTEISNQATVSYVIDNTNYAEESDTIYTKVAELLNVNCVWQDAANVSVNPGDTNQVLAFRVTNIGNGTDEYLLACLSILGGDDFDPSLVALHFDSNDNGLYDAGTDVIYQAGVNDPVLAADAGITLFMLNDIPMGPADGNLGNSRLTVASKTGTGTPGTIIYGAGEEGTNAVVGTSGADDEALGTYEISAGASVLVIKSATIADPSGGSEAVTGAVITYSLAVAVSGSGTALDVIITDVIPTDTTYIPGTLTLNGAVLTDEVDIDVGDVGGTTPGEATVDLGDLPAGSPVQTITFDVKIN